MPVLPLPAAPLVPPVALLLELSPVVSGPDEAPPDEGLPGAPEALEVAELLRLASARSSRPHAAADKASATLKAINEGFIMGSFLWSLSKADRNTRIDTHGASQEACRTRRMVSGRVRASSGAVNVDHGLDRGSAGVTEVVRLERKHDAVRFGAEHPAGVTVATLE